LESIGITSGRVDAAGVAFRASDIELYRANVWLRCATRIVVRVANFAASGFDEVVKQTSRLDWSPWISDTPITVRVTSRGSRLQHTGALAERIARGVGVPLARGEEPAQLIVARMEHDRLTISVDTSGDLLHRRGWRRGSGKAPLRETLAAAMLTAIGWDSSEALLDPMCGSGTVLIEAARMARGWPPGVERTHAFMTWPSFAPGTWASVAADARRAASNKGGCAPILGRDRDAGVIEAARSNAERAGVGDLITFTHGSLSATPRPEVSPGWLLTNPPYGHRIGPSTSGDLRNLHARLGQLVAGRLEGWRAAALVADTRLAAHAGMGSTTRLVTFNGGIKVSLMSTE